MKNPIWKKVCRSEIALVSKDLSSWPLRLFAKWHHLSANLLQLPLATTFHWTKNLDKFCCRCYGTFSSRQCPKCFNYKSRSKVGPFSVKYCSCGLKEPWGCLAPFGQTQGACNERVPRWGTANCSVENATSCEWVALSNGPITNRVLWARQKSNSTPGHLCPLMSIIKRTRTNYRISVSRKWTVGECACRGDFG